VCWQSLLIRRVPAPSPPVFDLPVVLETSGSFIRDHATSSRITLARGDFFQAGSLPQGDLVVLSRILHDWDDAKSAQILRNVFGALPSGGACLIFDMLLDDDPARGPLRAQLQSLSMLCQVGVLSVRAAGGGGKPGAECFLGWGSQTEGKERTEAQFRELLGGAGFGRVEVARTGSYLDAILAVKE
jgi:hypothetical protein